ncbi:sugar phosphate isomerase/epimerase [Candidatus Woesearchaeota archaeon]|nr:MAG: sugar phosphate isomerase/epimerase [Candidatus Woesearchaeota archaeon]
MRFGEGYFKDREGEFAPTAPLGIPDSELTPEDWELNEPHEGVKISDIGMSVPLGIAAGNVEGVAAKIRQGIGNIEIGFPGAFSGNRNAQTPGMWGREARQALKELAKANEVKFTTHAAYNIMGMTGQDQAGNFSNTRWQQARTDITRAIQFAADVAGGGSVVVHTGEFERPLTHIYPDGQIMNEDGTLRKNYARDPKTGRLMFRQRTTEAADFSFQLLDDRTGQVMQTVQGDRLVAQPVWLRSKEKKPYRDKNGNIVRPGDYIDYDGNLVEDPFNIRFQTFQTDKLSGGRVPEYDPETGRFKVRYVHHDDFEREAQEYNQYFKKIMGREPTFKERMTGREMFLKSTLETQATHSRGWALQYAEDIDKVLKAKKKLEELKEYWRKKEMGIDDKEKWKLLKQDTDLMRYAGDLLAPELKMPTELIDQRIKELNARLEFEQEASTSQEMQAHDAMETMRHLTTPEKFLKEHGVRGYAEAAYDAYRLTKDPKNPLVLNLENIFPERFAGHPQELKWLVKEVRKTFADMLTKKKLPWMESDGDYFKPPDGKPGTWKPGLNPYYQKGISRKEAEKLAERHIKVTLDTGHLNMWRKYFQPDPRKSPEENEKAFKKWYLEQVEDLAKNGLIGNVHLVDNYGYQDEHLAPGQGNAPIREVISILKKYGYDKAITVEPGADASTDQGDFWGVMKTWRHLGHNIYGTAGGPVRMGAPSAQSWTNIQGSYFGRSYPPYFIFGSYAPSNDWTLWSGVPLE